MDQQLKDCLIYTIWVSGPGDITYSPGGTETITSQRAVKAYWERININQGVSEGTTENANDMIICEEAITSNDRIWLPNQDRTDLSAGRKPIRVDTLPDVTTGGVSHYEVEL